MSKNNDWTGNRNSIFKTLGGMIEQSKKKEDVTDGL